MSGSASHGGNLMVEASPDGGGLPTDYHGQDYGRETLPNAKMVEASPDGGGLPTDYHGQDYGQETLPNAKMVEASPDGGDLPTDYHGRATVGRPCPTR